MKDFGTAIILAGGESSRMGFDKQFLELNQERLIDRLVRELEREFDEILIISNKPEDYKEDGYKVFADKIPGKGPLSGIHAGLTEASSKYSFLVACDMPNINLDYARYMMDSMKEGSYEACLTKIGDRVEPFSSFYSKELIPRIERRLEEGRRSIVSVLDTSRVKYIQEEEARKFSPDWHIFINLNTVEDLKGYMDKYKEEKE